MWHEVLGEDFLRRKRLSRIYYNRKFFYYPLRPYNALMGLGLSNSFLIFTSYLWAQLPFLTSYLWAQLWDQLPLEKSEETFEQWVSNRFGKRLYNTFFKTYTEKVWGILCREISAEWAAQRIKGLSLLSALKNALVKQQNNKKTVVKTLIAEFDYPKRGPGMMWEAVADIVENNGSQVRLDAEAERIFWNDNKIEALEIQIGGRRKLVKGTHFISSIPIRELIRKFEPSVPEEVLKAAMNLNYRDFLAVAVIVNKSDVFPDNWIYIHDPDVKVGRIQNFKNWSPYMVPDPNKTCLGLEYFCFEGDELWTMSDQELIELGKKELENLAFVRTSDVEGGTVVRMPKAYPVYDSEYRESLRIIRQFLSSIDNLQLVGRNGMHRYNNMDHSMLTAMMAAENVMGANHDLWKVNADQEYHEEIASREGMEFDEIDRAIIQTFFSRMDKLGFATAIGSVSGLLIFIATLWLTLKGGVTVGPNLQLLGEYFIGYAVTVKGAFIGAGYSFLWGFLFGWLFAYFRNLFIALFIYRVKRKLELLSFYTHQ